MASLEELKSQLIDCRENEQILLNLIGGHPDNIRRHLPGISHPLLEKISLVQFVRGWTDSRKNPMYYSGYKFILDGQTYEAITGSNWCDNFTVCENAEGKHIPMPSWEQWSEDGDAIQQLLDEEYKPAAVIGLALLYLNGLVG